MFVTSYLFHHQYLISLYLRSIALLYNRSILCFNFFRQQLTVNTQTLIVLDQKIKLLKIQKWVWCFQRKSPHMCRYFTFTVHSLLSLIRLVGSSSLFELTNAFITPFVKRRRWDKNVLIYYLIEGCRLDIFYYPFLYIHSSGLCSLFNDFVMFDKKCMADKFLILQNLTVQTNTICLTIWNRLCSLKSYSITLRKYYMWRELWIYFKLWTFYIVLTHAHANIAMNHKLLQKEIKQRLTW